MANLLYLNPYQHQTPGIQHKVDGEIAALQTRHHVTEYALVPCVSGRMRRAALRVVREAVLPFRLLAADTAYYRYSPACPLANLWIGLLASRRRMWVEYNAAYRQELAHVSPSLVLFHRLSMAILRRSNVMHIAVTPEIARKEALPNGCRIMPNGYSIRPSPAAASPPVDERKLDGLRQARHHGWRVLVFAAGHNTPWQGVDRVLDLAHQLGDVCLALAGQLGDADKLEEDWTTDGVRVVAFGELSQAGLERIYPLADAGLGPFAIDRKGLKQACPLKVRDYLCHGLPAVINYDDPLLCEDWARQHMLRYADNPSDLRRFLNRGFDRTALQSRAQQELDWTATMERARVL